MHACMHACERACTCVYMCGNDWVSCFPGPSVQTDIVRSADGIASVITFQPTGPRTIDVEFNITNDVALETIETFSVRLSSSSGVNLGAIPITNVVVVDDDG